MIPFGVNDSYGGTEKSTAKLPGHRQIGKAYSGLLPAARILAAGRQSGFGAPLCHGYIRGTHAARPELTAL